MFRAKEWVRRSLLVGRVLYIYIYITCIYIYIYVYTGRDEPVSREGTWRDVARHSALKMQPSGQTSLCISKLIP